MSNGARVVAVADSDSRSAQELARLAGARASTLDALYTNNEIQVVHVCTPPEAHYDIIAGALAAGKHVLSEKPLGATVAQVRSLHSTASAAGVLLCPSHQMPFQRGVRRFIAARQRLGTIRHVVAEICTAGADQEDDVGKERIVRDILPHPLSLSRAFGVSPLADASWNARTSGPGELLVIGSVANVGVSFLLSAHGRPTSNAVRVIADAGTVTFDLFHGYSVFESGGASRLRKLTRPFAGSGLTIANATANGLRRAIEGETAFPGLRELVRRFYQAVSGAAASPISAEESIDIAVAREAIIEAAARSS
jgi:predicted dehydrogenase